MKNFFFPKLNSLSRTAKICLTGLLIALTILAQKVFAINYLSFAPFLRISFAGPCLIILTSIFLGPLHGLVVGVASDLLGYLFFDPKAYPLFFQITLIYGLLGFSAYYLFLFFNKIKNEKVVSICLVSFLSILYFVILVFLLRNNSVSLFSSTYEIKNYQKLIILSLLGVLFIGLLLFIFIYNKKKFDENKDIFSPLKIGFACLILEILVMVIVGSLMKAWAFGFKTYLAILLTQIMVLFINVPMNTVLLTLLLRAISSKYISNNKVE